MVIQEEIEMPLEQSSRKNVDVAPELENYKFLDNELPRDSKHKSKKVKRKLHSINEDLLQKSARCHNDNSENVNEINKNDLEELRSVYRKCKAIVKKIEIKYGHLLDVDSPGPSEDLVNLENEEKCTCALNKKIVFEDDGTEVAQEPYLITHICPKKLNIKPEENNSLEIEYEGPDTLPDDLLTLSNLLQDPDLETTLRNKIISKIRLIRQDYMSEVRFCKHVLVEKLKVNPDEVLDFQGTNLSSLLGYPI